MFEPIFATAPAASKYDARIKSGQKWLNNNNLALLVCFTYSHEKIAIEREELWCRYCFGEFLSSIQNLWDLIKKIFFLTYKLLSLLWGLQKINVTYSWVKLDVHVIYRHNWTLAVPNSLLPNLGKFLKIIWQLI